jgi:hypothetical protein
LNAAKSLDQILSKSPERVAAVVVLQMFLLAGRCLEQTHILVESLQ